MADAGKHHKNLENIVKDRFTENEMALIRLEEEGFMQKACSGLRSEEQDVPPNKYFCEYDEIIVRSGRILKYCRSEKLCRKCETYKQNN